MTTEHGDGRDMDRSLALLWGDRTRPARGRPALLSLDRIVAAAVEVADELARTHGLEALSMRAIAAHLGVGTMSLYRYVPGKSELLDLMLDHVIEVPGPEEDGDRTWREIMTAEAHDHWRLCMQHPWYPFVDQSRPILGPNAFRGLDRLFRLLRPATGLTDRTLMKMVIVQEDYVDGAARNHILELRAVNRTGTSSEDFWNAQAPSLIAAINSGDYPVMADMDDDVFDSTYDETFGFGLTSLHEGFAAHIEQDGR